MAEPLEARGALPPSSPGRGWIAALVMATVGVAIGWYGPLQILLPTQVEHIAGTGKESVLALVTGSGAAAAMIANPAWGALSDRLRARGHSRLPVLVAGVLLAIAGLMILPFAHTPALVTMGWLIAQTGLNGPFAVLTALIADRVPDARRGLVGSLFGVAQLVGTVVGTAVAVVIGEVFLGYLAVAVAVPLLIAPFVVLDRRLPADVPTDQASDQPMRAGERRLQLRSVRIDRVFVAAFSLRFLLNLVSAIGLLYLLYFLTDRARVDEPATWVLVLTVAYVAVAGTAAALAGPLSDRIGRRTPLAAGACLVLAVGAVTLAFAGTMPLIVTAVLLLGVGYGLFLGVDVAIITNALPDPRTRATLLGVASIGSTLPQVLAPVIAAPTVTSIGGYPLLYLVTAAIALLALATLPTLRRRVRAV
ncbi:MFS transporter [Kytococcus sedentarius]|uniref:MFS transporter n=1 Tax=Kytococcus sedentarius TaxID=1276 RepID=UPI0035BBCEB2